MGLGFVFDLLAKDFVHLGVFLIGNDRAKRVVFGHDEEVPENLSPFVAQNKPGGGVFFVHGLTGQETQSSWVLQGEPKSCNQAK